MFPEFTLDGSSTPPKTLTEEEQKQLDETMSRVLSEEERTRLERLLLERLQQRKAELAELWGEINGHWHYEDHFYRYYHGSFKVYSVQTTTEKAAAFLRDLLPERKLNMAFERIIRDGTGKEFELEHNRDWDRHVRPMLETFAHARFIVEMAVRYGDLEKPPQPLPSGYAALLYLYDLR